MITLSPLSHYCKNIQVIIQLDKKFKPVHIWHKNKEMEQEQENNPIAIKSLLVV